MEVVHYMIEVGCVEVNSDGEILTKQAFIVYIGVFHVRVWYVLNLLRVYILR